MGLNFSNLKGDTFDAVEFEMKLNNVAVNLTGAVIVMDLKHGLMSSTETPVLTLTSVASAGITITAPTLGKFKINSQIIDIEVGYYNYDITITFADGSVKTYISGEFKIY
jgi:hypothetical protein